MRFSFLLLIPLQLLALPGFFEPWGKDCDLKYSPTEPDSPKHSFVILGVKKIIQFHQQVLSPVDGPRSHFRPSSSSYMWESIAKYGFFEGYIRGCDRLLRENSDPWVYQTAIIDGQLWKIDLP